MSNWYSVELKLEIVMAHQNGIPPSKLAFMYSVPEANIRVWEKEIRKKGVCGINKSRNRCFYTMEFKLDVIDCYKTPKMTLADVSQIYNINPELVFRWVKQFDSGGQAEVRRHHKGTDIMTKKNRKNLTEPEKRAYEKRISDLESQLQATEKELIITKKIQALKKSFPTEKKPK